MGKHLKRNIAFMLIIVMFASIFSFTQITTVSAEETKGAVNLSELS